MGPRLAETSAFSSFRGRSWAGQSSLSPANRRSLTSSLAETRCYPSAAMAKRTRYPNRTSARQAAKRAQRAAAAAPDGRLAPATPDLANAPLPVDRPDDEPVRASSSSLTDAEVQRAAQLEAEATAKEKAAIAESLRRRNRAAASDEGHVIGDVNAPLSVRAAHEYAYVSRDVKRIAVTGGLMIAILAVLHILVNVLGVITL